MRNHLLFIVLVLITGSNAFAQQARVHRFTTPIAGHVVLKDVDDKYNAQVYSLEMPDPDGAEDHKQLQAIKQQVAKQFPVKKKEVSYNKTTQALAPVVFVKYVADSFPGIPPDNYMAINKNNISVSVVNSTIAIHNAQTGQYVPNGRKGLKPFSAAVGLNNFQNDYRYDPKILYDPGSDRFIVIMLNSTDAHNFIVVGFSRTNDPSGAWNFYKFYGDYKNDNTWFDYPSITITQNEFFFTGNKIQFSTPWQTGFKESVIYQVRKQDGYNGDTVLNYQIWDSVTYNGNPVRCIHPLCPGATLQGPAQYFLSNRDFDMQNDSVFLIKVPDTIGSGNTNLTVTPLVSNINYGVPPDGRQPDTSVTLATNDGRVLGGYAEGNEIQFVSTTVNPATGGAAIYHGIISNYNTTPTLQAQIFGIDTLDLGYPNISYTGNQGGNNQSIISFDYAGPQTYPGFGAIFYDGTQYSPMVNIVSGDSSIKLLQLPQKEQRWGDYSGSQPDWNATGVVWVEGIYGRKNKGYGNYMAELLSPYFTEVPKTPQASSPVLYPNPAIEMISLKLTLQKEGNMIFTIYDAQGRVVDKILEQHCEEGQNVIQFNIGALHPGNYYLKATDTHGNAMATNAFVKP